MAKSEAMEEGISRLPEAIIHHVLSFLSPEEAIQTRLLSKEWLRAWQSCPVVRFHEPYIHDICPIPFSRDALRIQQKRRETFLNFVNEVMLNYGEHSNGINKLELHMSVGEDSTHLVNNWIKIAAENGLKKLQLFSYEWYQLPRSVIEAKSLEKLYLNGWRFEQPVTGAMWRNLRKLKIVSTWLSDEVLQKIIADCQLIEHLRIVKCTGLRKVKVTNLEKLKKLSVFGTCPILHIEDAPNMQFLNCSHLASVAVFSCQNLKILVLNYAGITDMFFANLKTKFPQLENLTIRGCRALHRIKIASNSLRVIHLDSNCQPEELEVDAPNIVWFEYRGKIISHVSFTRASTQWKSKIVITSSETIDNSWFFKLKGLLTNLTGSKIFLEISTRRDASLSTVDTVVDIIDGPVNVNHGPEIESLSLNLARLDPTMFSALLDGCFWSCRPKFIRQWWWYERATINFTKFLHEMLIESRNQVHADLQETKFWQKDLKEVKVVNSIRPERMWQAEFLDLSKMMTRKEWHRDVLNWKAYSEANPSHRGYGRRIIEFNLEWWKSIQVGSDNEDRRSAMIPRKTTKINGICHEIIV